MIITIDGPSGTGKSTVAKRVAAALGFTYFDTGAMFRAIAYGVIRDKIDYMNEEALADFLIQYPVTLKTIEGETQTHYFLGTSDATGELRRLDVTKMASQISTLKIVRDTLATTQRTLGRHQDSVFEGRDMGSVIFPEAKVKIFLTADSKTRAERRYRELLAKDPSFSLSKEQILIDINERDERDSKRELAPLKAALDAHIIDTSTLSIDEVVIHIIALTK
ncbi:MAG: cmk [Chlamydiia bacterium]|nr:cmk [Chlamydiia bacterium]